MEFRAPAEANKLNAEAIEYFTKNLKDPAKGQEVVEGLIKELGNAVHWHPDWHPIITAPKSFTSKQNFSNAKREVYAGKDHTRDFVRGFVTCPYSEERANRLVEQVNEVHGLQAYRLEQPLYADNAYPVVVEAYEVILEADGTIRSRDALRWFAQETVEAANGAQVAETWWNIRSRILGTPHGSRSSLFVNQHTGIHMRKILEALNNSGMYGPIKEESLDMLSKKKRDRISETLIRTAVKNWDKKCKTYNFELRDETCEASISDTWDDGYELSVRVKIGNYDLLATGFYYPEKDTITSTDPTGKRTLAEKFI